MSAFLENAMCNTGEGERSGETKKKKRRRKGKGDCLRVAGKGEQICPLHNEHFPQKENTQNLRLWKSISLIISLHTLKVSLYVPSGPST